MDIGLKVRFTAMVVDPTGSCKTRMIMNLIEKSESVSSTAPDEIIYCYGEWQNLFESVSPRVVFHEGMVNVKEDIPTDGRHRWLIIDDLMEEVSGKTETNALFTKISHHRNLSVFFIVQHLFTKENRLISLNSHFFLFFFKTRGMLSQWQH